MIILCVSILNIAMQIYRTKPSMSIKQGIVVKSTLSKGSGIGQPQPIPLPNVQPTKAISIGHVKVSKIRF